MCGQKEGWINSDKSAQEALRSGPAGSNPGAGNYLLSTLSLRSAEGSAV